MSTAPGACRFIVFCAAAWLAPAGDAWACTVCDSANGQEVRAALAEDDDVVVNVLAVTLPSLAFAGVVALVHFGWRAPSNDSREDGP